MMKFQKSAFLAVFAVLVLMLTSCTRSRMAATGRPVLYAEQSLHAPQSVNESTADVANNEVYRAADTIALATTITPVNARSQRTALRDRLSEAKAALDPEVFREKAKDVLRTRIAGQQDQDADVSDVPNSSMSILLMFLGFIVCIVGAYLSFTHLYQLIGIWVILAGILIGMHGTLRLDKWLRAMWDSDAIDLGPIAKRGLSVIIFAAIAFFIGMLLFISIALTEAEGMAVISAGIVVLGLIIGMIGMLIFLVGLLTDPL